jgi:hypothetical protein
VVAAFLFLCALKKEATAPDAGDVDPSMVPAE